MLSICKCINTLVLEDNPIDQDLLQVLIAKTPDISLLSIYSTVSEIIPSLLEGEIDLLIADIHLPDQNSLDLIRSLPKRTPDYFMFVLSRVCCSGL